MLLVVLWRELVGAAGTPGLSNCGSWRCLVRGSCPGTTTDVGEAVGGRAEPSAHLLRQLDDDPLRAADVAEPIAVFVTLHLANELRAAGSQAGADGVDVVDFECEMADARGVRRRVSVTARALPLAQRLES